MSVVCPNRTEYREVLGHFAVLIACYLRSANLSTFLSKLHHGFTGSLSILIVSMENLKNLNLSSIIYVTNTLKFMFSNSSGLVTAVQDYLPLYLSPQCIYHCSCITDLIILVPLIYGIKKALTLYSHLEVVSAEQNIDPQHN